MTGRCVIRIRPSLARARVAAGGPAEAVCQFRWESTDTLLALKGVGIDFITALSGSEFSLQSLTKKLIEAGKLSLVNVLDEEKKFFRNFNALTDFD